MRGLFQLLLVPAALLAADPYVSVGFLNLPSSVKMGAMSSVAIDQRSGDIYVLHRGEPPLLKFNAKGEFVSAWGEHLFKVAHGLRVDRDGNVWTTDNGNHVIRKFSNTGRLLAIFGEENVAGGDEKHFRSPDDLIFASNGDIYVADNGNGRIVHLSGDGRYIGEWGKKGKGEGEFNTAHGLAIDSRDRIYVADRGNNRVQVFRPDGKFVAMWSGFGNPFCLLMVGNQLLVSEGEQHKIIHIGPDGKVSATWGNPELLKLPHFMATSSDGTLYVAEVNGQRVQKFRKQ